MVLPGELKIVFGGWRTTQLTEVSVKKKTNYFVPIVLKNKVVNSCFREFKSGISSYVVRCVSFSELCCILNFRNTKDLSLPTKQNKRDCIQSIPR